MGYDYEESSVWYRKGLIESPLPEELQMKQEEWNQNALKKGLKRAKEKLALKSLEVTNITKDMFLRNWDVLQNMKSLSWIGEEQEFLDVGIDREFLAWAEYHGLISWWYRCQKFYVNKNTLESIVDFLEMFTEFNKK